MRRNQPIPERTVSMHVQPASISAQYLSVKEKSALENIPGERLQFC